MVEEVQPHKEYKMLYRVGAHWWPFDVFGLSVEF